MRIEDLDSKELCQHLGETVARAVLTRFGYVQGWRTAEALQVQFRQENRDRGDEPPAPRSVRRS